MSHHMLAMYIFIFAMCNLIHNHVISMDIGTMLYQESILVSDHRLLCHLFVGPLSASLVSGGPTINMCPRKGVSKVIGPRPLYYFNYYDYYYLSALRAEPATVLFILVVADKWGNSKSN